MWFAALGSYQNNPWVLSLSYRLLTGQKEVVDLLDASQVPFKTPPKYIRAMLYTYKYTKWGSQNWWTRTSDFEWLSPMSVESLTPYLKSLHIIGDKKYQLKIQNVRLQRSLEWIRKQVNQLSPTTFIYSLLSTAVAIAVVL